MSSAGQSLDPATRKVLTMVEDGELDARYPNRTHFVDAQNLHQALLTSRALFQGDPVAVIYPDGREVLFTPERADGFIALALLFVLAAWIKFRERPSTGKLIQLPPRTQVEVRDASGLPIAA